MKHTLARIVAGGSLILSGCSVQNQATSQDQTRYRPHPYYPARFIKQPLTICDKQGNCMSAERIYQVKQEYYQYKRSASKK